MKKFNFSIILFLSCLIMFLVTSDVALAATNKDSGVENIINDTIDYFTEEDEQYINTFSAEMETRYGSKIGVFVVDTKKIEEDLKTIAISELDKSTCGLDYLIAVDPINRNLTIASRGFSTVNSDEIVKKYSKEYFAQDDFTEGIIRTMAGIAYGYTAIDTEITETAPLVKDYTNVPSVNITSYITDNAALLSTEDEEKIQTNAYKLKNNYDYDVYFVIIGDTPGYEMSDYTEKAFNENFLYKDDVILIVMSFEEGSYSYISSSNIESINHASLYSNYAKSYFHLDEPDYVNGIITFQNAIISKLENVPISDVNNKTVSGTMVSGSMADVEKVKSILTTILSLIIIITVVLFAILLARSLFYQTKKADEAFLDEHPEVAFSEIKRAITIDQDEFIKEKVKETQVDEQINDFFKEVSSEVFDEDEIKDADIVNNIFDRRNDYSNVNEEASDIIISSINDMIIDVVKKCEGTKEYYAQLQEATNVYNSLSFTNKMKLDRSYTSQLEALTRKAKNDKEISERKS